jgi:hypothetical protein
MFKRSLMLIAAGLLGGALLPSWSADAPTAATSPAAAASAPMASGSAATPPAMAVPAVVLPSTPLSSAGAAASAPAASASAPSVADAASGPAGAASGPSDAASAPPLAATLDGRVQDVKSDVIKLNRDLLVLEEELLFPANTQVALFVSMDVGKMFELDSVQIKLDDKVVANYLYTALEVEALHRGGVQRVYLGNLRTGEHELTAFFTGKGPQDRDYKRGATVKFEKTTEAKYIELRIQDSTGKLQPEFDVKLWQ